MKARLMTTAIAAAGVLAVAGCSSDDGAPAASTTSSPGIPLMSSGAAAASSASSPGATTTCTYAKDSGGRAARPVTAPQEQQKTNGTTTVTFTINGGAIPMTLDRASAPCTVAAVVSLAQQKYYDGTPCHRITVPQGAQGLAVLQCGDPTGSGTGGPGFTIQDEKPTGLAPASMPGASLYPRGTVAMAKTSAPDSAGSQFFLVYADSALPPEYAVLGKIDPSGMAALDAVTSAGAKSADPSSPDSEKPKGEVTVNSAVAG